jgi:hypothetical protein
MTPRPGARERERQVLPFTLHQVGEYLLGAFAVLQAANFDDPAATTIALIGAGIIAAAMSTNGGAGLVRWVPPVAHRVLDIGLITTGAVSPWVFGFGGDLAAVLVVESISIALLVLSSFTRYRPAPPKPRPVPRARPRTRTENASRVAGYVAGKTARQAPRALGRVAARAARRRSRSRGTED